MTEDIAAVDLDPFRSRVWERGAALYRDLPWRRTRDPYRIWVSEVMLQQTQVSRVDGRWQHWCQRFPTVASLAEADSADVLAEWQGMGYNRRALALWRAAQAVEAAGGMPQDQASLVALPGVGPATAAGIRAFAWDLAGTYLETNVRAVFLHELLPGEEGVTDRRLAALVAAACPPGAGDVGYDPVRGPRAWYYALLDYGAWLKRNLPNPSRRSAAHVRQSAFEGSHRQKRAELVRVLLRRRAEDSGAAPVAALAEDLSRVEVEAGRSSLTCDDVSSLLEELAREGFCHREGDGWIA